MKKLSILVLAVLLAAPATFAAPAADIKALSPVLDNFTAAMADTLNVNSSIGDYWSDAFIGSFPHLGVGLTLGFTGTGTPDSFKDLFDELGTGIPSEIAGTGIPIPSLAITGKIGLPFLPIDVGGKFGMIPTELGKSLASLGIEASYTNIGLGGRVAVLKESFLIPDLSVGVFWNQVTGKVATPIGDSQTLSFAAGSDNYTVDMSKPKLLLDWKTNTFDFSAQVSKTLLFILTPYAGVGYTLGKSTVNTGLSSEVTLKKNGTLATDAEKTAFTSLISGLGFGDIVKDQGIIFKGTSETPTVRLYGGFSLNILLVLDFQVMYVPSTEKIGSSLTARFQL